MSTVTSSGGGGQPDDNDRLRQGKCPFDPEADAAEMTSGESSRETSATIEEWEPPSPLDSMDVPKFPVACLPSPLREFVVAVAETTQVPVDMPASLVLAAAAAAIQRNVIVTVNSSYSEPTSLYVAAVAEVATRKSAVLNAVTAPFKVWERNERERLHESIERARAEREIKEKRKAKLLDQAAKADDPNTRAEAQQEAGNLAVELANDGQSVVYPRILADDATPEALARLLAEQGERMAVFSAEGGFFEILAGRYSQGVPNLDIFLKGHSGDFLRIDRRTGPPVIMDQPALTLGLTVQPDVVRALSDKPGFRGRGVIGRVLYVKPATLVGHRRQSVPPVPDSVARQYERCIWWLLETKRNDAGNPVELTLSHEAAEARLAFATRLEPRLAAGGDLGHMGDWAGKAVGAAVRIAGLLHAVQCAQTERVLTCSTIQVETMVAAVELVEDYFIGHAQAALAEMGADPAIDNARQLLAWLLNHEMTEFSVRDLHQGVRGQACFRKVNDVKATLALLESHGHVRCLVVPLRGGPGRRQSSRYALNPLTVRRYVRNPQNPQS
jgi:hypothetical protein